ncbi:sulfoxide reductase heme-binding subunit YedZ [Rhizobium rhizoryzae]|uniref:Protein-methionine-sulfoxide reductase heme-binding subunit MsrQ n=2 Tax=Rhizobium rhizoryzae TaxID=451876 RepID=A0A7W6LDJ5_9HYPH|nr:sulfoxide reductase heme-binding subunit YedZ [Rhizobium rhizoryzae]
MTGGLGFNPVKGLEHLLGIWALRFLIAALVVTPLRDLTGINWFRYRRALGLLGFYYVLFHFTVYVVLDLRLDIHAVWADIVRRPYITIGMACLILLLPLAATSNGWSIRSLGPRWNTLHKLSYIILAGAVLHFVLARKSLTLEPATYIAIAAVLLGYRIVRKPLQKWRRPKRHNQPVRQT